jgi:hypothetical protein
MMQKRVEWVKPRLTELDASKTLGGTLSAFTENFILVNETTNEIIDRGVS